MANRPKPTRIKQLEGNPGKRSLNKKEPQPANKEPECPSFLTKYARIEFKRVCFELREMGILHSADTGVIACLAEAWADWRKAREEIAKKGRWTEEKAMSGAIYYAHYPWMTLEKKAKADILKFSVELGLSPSARSRIQITEKAQVDEMEKYLSGGKKPIESRKENYKH